jgi:molecular chaperone HtpG
MTSPDKITFEIETSRVLEILSRDIYDSPYALLRENVQNAYDAILMRVALERTSMAFGRIDITLTDNDLTITDNGIGMTEDVLRNNFWKAGSSGKATDLARKSGVIGTFGIGAMANFGVCLRLSVETRAVGSDETLISSCMRDKLSISHECIELRHVKDARLPGTVLSVLLDSKTPIAVDQAIKYLDQYVKYLPVPVFVNGTLISQQSVEDRFLQRTKDVKSIGSLNVELTAYNASVETYVDTNGIVSCRVGAIKLAGQPVSGELTLLQGSGQLMGHRSSFGLAPVPVGGHYQLGGIANLSILYPTAGREALSRESITHINNLINMAEFAISEHLATTIFADKSNSFMHYISANQKLALASRVSIEMQPSNRNVYLGELKSLLMGKSAYYYTGRDRRIIDTFASDQAPLICVSQSNPRKGLQIKYLKDILKINEVPDRATVVRVFEGSELSFEEVALVIRILSTLSDDYLLPNATVKLAEISHGVNILVEKDSGTVSVYISRDMVALKPVLNCYRSAPEVFTGFVKDFVRGHIYSRISDFLPSSTKQGADALFKLLQKNKELYRYEQNELGELEPLIADLLAGGKTLVEVLQTARKKTTGGQSFRLRRSDVGSVEQVLPGIEASPISELDPGEARDYSQPAPPILRTDLVCEHKILMAGTRHPQLNNFELFLGLSDRALKREGDFFRSPHTTKVIWAGHRIVYIFGHASGALTLYYDIELKEPLRANAASGAMLPSTTLITQSRIFVPVPAQLVDEFKIVEGAKEFYVRFDILVTEGRVDEGPSG